MFSKTKTKFNLQLEFCLNYNINKIFLHRSSMVSMTKTCETGPISDRYLWNAYSQEIMQRTHIGVFDVHLNDPWSDAHPTNEIFIKFQNWL